MKNKVYAFLSIIGMGIIVVFANTINAKERVERYHQHQEATEKASSEYPDVFSSHLPVVSINTKGKKIPGAPLLNEFGKRIGYELSDSGDKMIDVDINIFDQQEHENTLLDDITLHSSAMLRIRGDSSRYFDKSSYLIRMTDSEGEYNDLPVMGMSPHYEWALHGPFLDKTLLRNYMWYNIAGEISSYAPNVRYSEVFIDGEYKGLYVMTETIAASKERVYLKTYGNGKTVTSWIARIDTYEEKNQKNLDHFSFYTLKTNENKSLSVIYPGKEILTEKNIDLIEKDISSFEKALYSYDYQDSKKGYRAFIDVNSFVDYYILMEFTAQHDMSMKSTYLTKDARTKIKLSPLWDFNNILDNYIAITYEPQGFYFTDRLWFEMLLKDDYFVEKVIQRYRYLRTNWLEEEYLLTYVDETLDYLDESIERNFDVWGYSFNPEVYDPNQYLTPNERNPKSHYEAVEQMTSFLVERGEWMDAHIESLRQFSHESKNKKYDRE